MREQFEKLNTVKEILSDHSDEVVFNEGANEYEAPMYENWIPEYAYELNFGWRVFQEQQRKIDAVDKYIFDYMQDSEFGDAIKELLR